MVFPIMQSVITMALAATVPAKQPHIVFFLADDYGFADVGYHVDMYGNATNRIHTPNLDHLSSTGIRLENYYIQPVCSPTRATLMTGRYVFHHGVHVPFIDSSRSTLPLNETTLAERLKSAGYESHMVGKWHLGFRTWAHVPENRGFDSFYGYYAGSQDYFNHESLCWPGQVKNGCFENTTSTGEAVTGLDLHADNRTMNSSEYSTILYTTVANNIINGHAERFAVEGGKFGEMSKPLFLYLPHQAVHVGNIVTKLHPEYGLDQAPMEYIKQYSWVQNEQRRNLSAMVTAMDEAAGNITSTLRSAGLWDDTIFIFSTDNGGPGGDMASNYPLYGGKGTVWEGGVRGIGFISGGHLESLGFKNLPRVSKGLMHVSDWNPTLCQLVGGCPMASKLPLDGISALDMLMNGANESGVSNRTEIYHDICLPWMGGSCLEHLAPNPNAEGAMYASLLRGDYKLIVGQKGNNNPSKDIFIPLLFNIKDDPSETTNIASTSTGAPIVKDMMASIMAMSKTAGVAHDRDPIDPMSNPELHGGVWMPWDN